MTRLLQAALAAALTLSLVAAAGCGSSGASKANDYIKAVNKAQTDFAASVAKVQGQATQQPTEVFAKFKTAIDKVVADIKAVPPPDKVKSLHNELIGELTRFGDAVDSVGSVVAGKDPAKILKAQTTFATDLSQLATKMTTTIDAINTKLHQ
jgi:hypothetical protein